jgi:pyruvate,water dikinase
VIEQLQHLVRQAEAEPGNEAALPAQRDPLVSRARDELRGHPARVVAKFEAALRAAQVATVLSEDHNFFIDAPTGYWLRQLFLELGRRFVVAGIVDKPEDIFQLTLEEVRDEAGSLPGINRRRIVAARWAEMEYFRAIAPPPMLGIDAPEPDDPVSRAFAQFWGAAPPDSGQNDHLVGLPGSPGIARGPARIIRGLADTAALQPGDVLVAETASPHWTPLFSVVAALVTDAGGVLCHCAVVAREYGLPAVVGTGRATQTLRAGQMVEVDGSAGIVHVLTQD